MRNSLGVETKRAREGSAGSAPAAPPPKVPFERPHDTSGLPAAPRRTPRVESKSNSLIQARRISRNAWVGERGERARRTGPSYLYMILGSSVRVDQSGWVQALAHVTAQANVALYFASVSPSGGKSRASHIQGRPPSKLLNIISASRKPEHSTAHLD